MKLTTKVENYEGMLSGVSEQFHSGSDKYYGKLEESQQLFQQVIAEKQTDIIKLRSMFDEKEAELVAKEKELQTIVEKQRLDNEQNTKDTEQLLASKVEVIEQLQCELEEKEKQLQRMVQPVEDMGQAEMLQLPEDKTMSCNVELESLRSQLAEKTAELESLRLKSEASDSSGGGLEGGGGSEGGGGKRDYKFIKYKAQTTAKIKSLEKQVEELQKVHCFGFNLWIDWLIYFNT